MKASMKAQTMNNDKNNPYEKIFDDAGRKLSEVCDLDFLKTIPDDNTDSPQIPFPYGGEKAITGWNPK